MQLPGKTKANNFTFIWECVFICSWQALAWWSPTGTWVHLDQRCGGWWFIVTHPDRFSRLTAAMTHVAANSLCVRWILKARSAGEICSPIMFQNHRHGSVTAGAESIIIIIIRIITNIIMATIKPSGYIFQSLQHLLLPGYALPFIAINKFPMGRL